MVRWAVSARLRDLLKPDSSPKTQEKSHKQFQRLVDWFLNTGSVNQQPLPGPRLITADINRVKDYFTMNPRAHLRSAMVDLDMSIGKIWKILRREYYSGE